MTAIPQAHSWTNFLSQPEMIPRGECVDLPPNDNQTAAAGRPVERGIKSGARAGAGRSATWKGTGISCRSAVLGATHGRCAAHSALVLYARLTGGPGEIHITTDTNAWWCCAI